MNLKNIAGKTALLLIFGGATVWAFAPPRGAKPGPLASGEALKPEGHGGQSGGLVLVPDRPVPTSTFVEPGTLRVEGRLGHTALSATQGGETYLYFDVKAPAGVQASAPPPLALSLVIDRSGSMMGKRITNAIAAARGMLERLRDGDLVSLVAYDQTAHLVFPATVVTNDNRAALVAKLLGIHAQGETCISCGLEAGVAQLTGEESRVKRLVLLSDGIPTVGLKEPAQFLALAERARDAGVSIRALGVDVDYNEKVMSAIARGSNGRHTFVQDPAELTRIFEEEARALRETVATGATLTFTLARGVTFDKVFDRAYTVREDVFSVPLGTFSGGDAKTVLVKVRVPRGVFGEQAVAQVDVRYRDLVNSKEGFCHGALALMLNNGDPSLLDPLVAARLQRTETADTLLKLNGHASDGDTAGALRLIHKKREELTRGSTEAAKVAPGPLRVLLQQDYAQQNEALDRAAAGFASPPPMPGSAPMSGAAASPVQAQKSAVRRNAETADALGN